jgi:hypothetical protein
MVEVRKEGTSSGSVAWYVHSIADAMQVIEVEKARVRMEGATILSAGPNSFDYANEAEVTRVSWCVCVC